ncbi:MAG: methyl-accepting chemotaxis protein, partial [Myxococcota bacterium]
MARQSIDRRLTLAVISTTAASVLVACVLFVLYDLRTGREALYEKSEMLARVVAMSSSVAMAFGDDLTARENLEGLSGTSTVRAAAIYDGSGARFVEYQAPETGGHFAYPEPEKSGRTLVDGRLDLYEPLVFQGQEVGTLYIAYDASALTDRISWYAMIVGFVMAGAALWSAWVAGRLRRHFAVPLTELAEATVAISKGDLSARASMDRDDEIGALAGTFNEMGDSLRGVVAQTRQSIGAVSEVALGLEEGSAKLSRESQRQAAAIAEARESLQQVSDSVVGLNQNASVLAQTSQDTGASIEQMQAAIGEIAAHMDHLANAIETTSAATHQVTTNIDTVVEGVGTLQGATGDVIERLRELNASVGAVQGDAEQSLQISESAGREAANGKEAVAETIQTMGAIATAFGQLQDRVSRLARKSESIDAIVKVIKEVAEQTGLLSLNAAIIAAQAGEHGRAFSVVADQVSSLADRSHRSAREIADLIREVQ